MNGTMFANGFPKLYFHPIIYSFNSLNMCCIVHVQKPRFSNDPTGIYVQLCVLVFVQQGRTKLEGSIMSSTEGETNGSSHDTFPNGVDRDVTVFVSSFFPLQNFARARVASAFVLVCQ